LLSRAASTIGLALALASVSRPAAAGEVTWATRQATELSRQAAAHAARGEVDLAQRRYRDALELDPTYGPAYLALGRLHEAAGDARESERAYSTGIDHVAGFADGYVARARLRVRMRRHDEAAADLRAASSLRPDDPALLEELSTTYVALGALPAALAVTRRLGVLAESRGDADGARKSRIAAKALARLVAEADPVTAAAGRGPVRVALAAHARRR
jgi:tetratricopeptide (TPR) repeat protein